SLIVFAGFGEAAPTVNGGIHATWSPFDHNRFCYYPWCYYCGGPDKPGDWYDTTCCGHGHPYRAAASRTIAHAYTAGIHRNRHLLTGAATWFPYPGKCR